MISFCKSVLEVLNLLNAGIRDFCASVHYWIPVYPPEQRGTVVPVAIPVVLRKDERVKRAYRIVARTLDDALSTLEYVVNEEKKALGKFDAVYVVLEVPGFPGKPMAEILQSLEFEV